MKKLLIKILRYSLFTLAFCITLLVFFILNPVLLYANKTEYKNFTIYHEEPIPEDLGKYFETILQSLESSEIYNKNIKIDICLNDGSAYPKLIETLLGPDVIRTFSNKSVYHTTVNDWASESMIKKEWNEDFNISQWAAHSFVHCLQFDHYGLFGSNPMARIPEWKWEGYCEYLSMQINKDLNSLIALHKIPRENKFTMVSIDDFKTTSSHLKFLVLMKYCFEIKKMNFDEIVNAKNTEDEIYSEMMKWYMQN
jgi:hypothetical protein